MEMMRFQQLKPTSIRVSLGTENVRFNERVQIDNMYIGHWPVLHIVDVETHFSAATFLPDVSSETIWSTFLRSCVNIYTALPNRLLVDGGSALGTSQIFASIAEISNMELQATGTEAHSRLRLGERYHRPSVTHFATLPCPTPSTINNPSSNSPYMGWTTS